MKVVWNTCEREIGEMKLVNENYYIAEYIPELPNKSY